MTPSRISSAVRIAGVYLVLAVAWIFLSDRLVRWAFPDADTISWFQTLKGLGFVIVSAGLILVLTRRSLARVERTAAELRRAYDQTLMGWAAALDIRDHSTGQHTERVTALAVELARRFDLDGDALDDIQWGAMLHDIGKMAVPDRILGKEGPLTDDEWRQMRQHPEVGRRMLEGISFLESAAAIPWCHHEWWDGSGYPRGLSGEEIPFPARVFAVVDVYDALTSERPYRDPISPQEALAQVEEGSGVHFDPAVVREFVAMMRDGERSARPGERGRL